MARSAKTASVVLKDRNDARMTGIRILEGEDGQLAYSWDYAPALAPTVAPADVSYGTYTPDQEITWSQNNWSIGKTISLIAMLLLIRCGHQHVMKYPLRLMQHQ